MNLVSGLPDLEVDMNPVILYADDYAIADIRVMQKHSR